MTPGGFPHSEILGSRDVCSSPRLIAACRVLLRLPVPRHPPCALGIFIYRPRFARRSMVSASPDTLNLCSNIRLRSYCLSTMRTTFLMHGALGLWFRIMVRDTFVPRAMQLSRCAGRSPEGRMLRTMPGDDLREIGFEISLPGAGGRCSTRLGLVRVSLERR